MAKAWVLPAKDLAWYLSHKTTWSKTKRKTALCNAVILFQAKKSNYYETQTHGKSNGMWLYHHTFEIGQCLWCNTNDDKFEIEKQNLPLKDNLW